jgi:hypothetical protein
MERFAPPWKSLPVTVTAVPPDDGPEAGAMAPTPNVGVGVTVGVSVAVGVLLLVGVIEGVRVIVGVGVIVDVIVGVGVCVCVGEQVRQQ